jgi:multicomponent K+:H+ antiporter subunit C
MEFLLSIAVGILTAGGTYLVLRQRTFPVILGVWP